MEQKKLQLLLKALTKNGKKQTAAKLLDKMLHSSSFLALQNRIDQANPLFRIQRLTKGNLIKFQSFPLTSAEQLSLSFKFFLNKPSRLPKGFASHLIKQIKDPSLVLKPLTDWLRTLNH